MWNYKSGYMRYGNTAFAWFLQNIAGDNSKPLDTEFAGTVEDMGINVTDFRKGDKVFAVAAAIRSVSTPGIDAAQQMLLAQKKIESAYAEGNWIEVLRLLPLGQVAKKEQGENLEYKNNTNYKNFLYKISYNGSHVDDVIKSCIERLGGEIPLEYFQIERCSGGFKMRLKKIQCSKNTNAFLCLSLCDVLEVNIIGGTYCSRFDSFLKKYMTRPAFKAGPFRLPRHEITMLTYEAVKKYLEKPTIRNKLRMIFAVEAAVEKYEKKENKEKLKFRPMSLYHILQSLRRPKQKYQDFVDSVDERMKIHQDDEDLRKDDEAEIVRWMHINYSNITSEFKNMTIFIEHTLGYNSNK